MRLIDADALMKALGITDMSCWACDWGCRGWCTRSRDFSEACAAIEDTPTIDAVPVVRCKNCINWAKDASTIGNGRCSIHSTFYEDDITGEMDFCSYGERRSDETY